MADGHPFIDILHVLASSVSARLVELLLLLHKCVPLNSSIVPYTITKHFFSGTLLLHGVFSLLRLLWFLIVLCIFTTRLNHLTLLFLLFNPHVPSHFLQKNVQNTSRTTAGREEIRAVFSTETRDGAGQWPATKRKMNVFDGDGPSRPSPHPSIRNNTHTVFRILLRFPLYNNETLQKRRFFNSKHEKMNGVGLLLFGR